MHEMVVLINYEVVGDLDGGVGWGGVGGGGVWSV